MAWGTSPKMVIVVRGDLNIGKGKVASQVAHAAVSLYVTSRGSYAKFWLLQGQPKVVLKAFSVRDLMSLHESAKACNLNVCAIRDAGRTQIEAGTLTAVGIGPHDASQIDTLTKDFKLL